MLVVRDVTDARDDQRLRERFLSALGHELRTPLSTLRLAADLLRRGAEPVPRTAERITRSVRRMERMVGELLDLARLRTRTLHIAPRTCDLGRLVTELVDDRPPDEAVRIAVRVQGDPLAFCDADRLAQVVENLVRNALHYAPASRVQVVLDGSDRHWVQLAVSDRGPGIPAEDLGRIFQAFYRGAAGPPPNGGLGLGLFIVSEIVRLHGGAIDVVSRPGEGTTFRVRLPRAGVRPRAGSSARRSGPARRAWRPRRS